MPTLILWVCVFLNLFAFAYHTRLRHQLKKARGRDAALLRAAAEIVRCAARGEYIDGTWGNMIADDLDAHAMRALIIGGYMDKEVKRWHQQLRGHDNEADHDD